MNGILFSIPLFGSLFLNLGIEHIVRVHLTCTFNSLIWESISESNCSYGMPDCLLTITFNSLIWESISESSRTEFFTTKK